MRLLRGGRLEHHIEGWLGLGGHGTGELWWKGKERKGRGREGNSHEVVDQNHDLNQL